MIRKINPLGKALLIFLFSLTLLPGCQPSPPKMLDGPLFAPVNSSTSGIDFANEVKEDSIWNVFNYTNLYSGGGVAIGDLNNDELPDIYFTANQGSNKLFLNQGNLKFEDITSSSFTGGSPKWTTGVTLADVNADGWMDIYVCQGGVYANPEPMKNLLYINNGDLTFSEMAESYGVADQGRSVHASFFDADRDGDLDLYVLNHPDNFHAPLEERIAKERNPQLEESDHFYLNQNGKFVLANQQAGIMNYGFGLSVTTSDLDGDGWTDIFVANDYSEPDYYWRNNGDGTFSNLLNQAFFHISNFSMGADAGDVNNDGLQDIFVADMMAKDNRRKKTNMSGMNPEAFWDNVNLGRHYQYMQNVLQLNNGNGSFSEIAELAGVANTDWSWSPLIADLDNDGWKDLVVTNGMRRELRNNDYAKKLIGLPLQEIQSNYQRHLAGLPEEKISNFAFRNQQDLSFSDQSKAWGLDHKGFSNGSAVADLDLDGDLDLVLNNLEEQASLLENRSISPKFLRLQAEGPAGNPFGIGLKAKITTESGIQYQQLTQSRGFQSASEPIIHFGLGQEEEIITLELIWPDGQMETLQNLGPGRMKVSYKNADQTAPRQNRGPFMLASSVAKTDLKFTHLENAYNDFDKEVLLPHIYSQNGPLLAKQDVNGDGLEDIFIGGASGQPGALFLQDKLDHFVPGPSQPWSQHALQEDMGSLFFDANGDQAPDLLVLSGSNEWEPGHEIYQPRLYLNDGKGNFSFTPDRLPDLRMSGGRACAADFDQDGDQDLFIGGRLTPGQYPFPAQSALLLNEEGKFKDATAEIAPELRQPGMVTDALWMDFDGDQDLDLVICGEWMPIRIFEQENGKLSEATAKAGLEQNVGWWYSLSKADIDQDGDLDLIAGNLGLNTKYRASNQEPFEVFAGDLDENGKSDIVLGYHQNGKAFPVRGRECSSQQISNIKEKFPSYEKFGTATLPEIYGPALEGALHYAANWMQSSYLENQGDGTFAFHPLPNQAQISPVMGSVIHDLDGDGHLDLVLAGNMLNAEVETCRHDASIGLVLLGDGKGNFNPLPFLKSGLFVSGDIKDILILNENTPHPIFVMGRNNGPLAVFQKE